MEKYFNKLIVGALNDFTNTYKGIKPKLFNAPIQLKQNYS